MLVTGHAPFQEANDSETLTMILDCKYYLPPSLTTECQDLIKLMLVRDPEKRILLDNISKHEWLNMCQDNHDYGDDNDREFDDQDNDSYNEEPLIKFNNLSQAENDRIIKKMINGSIAAKEEIIK
jgi:SNF-related kinase